MIRKSVKRFPKDHGQTKELKCDDDSSRLSCGYFSLIGVPVFSAGAGGNAGCAPAFCASASGRAGSGAGVVGRAPPGVDSAGTSFCGSDVDDGVGCVACASCVGGLLALISANDSAEMAVPATISAAAISQSLLPTGFCS